MRIRSVGAATIAALAVVGGASADSCPHAATNAVACFELSGFAKAAVESYGAMATEVDVHWSTTNSLEAWLTPSAASAQHLLVTTRASMREPRLTDSIGRWVYTWAKWPAPMIRSAPRRCLGT
jgi:hypothetical protein